MHNKVVLNIFATTIIAFTTYTTTMNKHDLKNSLGYLTNKTNGLFRIYLNREIKKSGLNLTTEHLSILAVISKNPNSSQSEISEKVYETRLMLHELSIL